MSFMPTVSTAEAWGYGFLFVTLINLGALAGVWIVPLMNKKLYKTVLMFLIALAVGTLCGSAILSLIPEAHGMTAEHDGHRYIWKNMLVILAIYIFFNTERILKIIGNRRLERARLNDERVPSQSSIHVTAMHHLDSNSDRVKYLQTPQVDTMATNGIRDGNNTQDMLPSAISHRDVEDVDDVQANELELLSEQDRECQSKDGGEGDSASHDGSLKVVRDVKDRIAIVAYMIIFGDGLHNFIDGLAIGASFTSSVYQGISTSVAVICEEFPHELGDFAILLNSGMSVKQAVLANFLSACTCYLGLILGLVLGQNFQASEWIFALAGGMFLYISLVDMLPEINNAGGDDADGKSQTSFKVLLLQNAGLVTGFLIILLLALFAGRIQF
ncbi:metal cation symporter ZIP14-like [Diadema antillarum]|uniref:metal cation symporter ZIP14-like n=1 Tax=Diadema antillarum TaxID=105358 RepID=UPI003A88E9D6